MNKKIIVTNSFRETQKIGEGFARKKGACLIALYGDLGSGKTTFVQGLAEGLGIKRRIISPTFTIVRSYALKSQKSSVRQAQDDPESIEGSKVKSQNYNSRFKSLEPRSFYHIDLYRIDNKKSIEGLGIEEIINNPENIVAIEWAQNLGGFLPKRRIEIRFSYIDRDKRGIQVSMIGS